LKQAPLKFQEHLQQCLNNAGYSRLTNDPCIYIKRIQSEFSILSIHVDDILQVSNSDNLISELHKSLLQEYKSIVFHPKARSYLGLTINRSADQRQISLSQFGLIEKIAKENEIPTDLIAATPTFSNTPNQLDLFTYNSDQKERLTNKQQTKLHKHYLSLIMSLMFLARMTRPDILLTVSYLATKTSNPTQVDLNRLYRIISYLINTKNYGLHINCTSLELHAHCDASYGSHIDGHSHTGYVISFGSNHSFLLAKSAKQKVAGLSSTDAELIAAADCAKTLVWIQNLLQELTLITTDPFILYQDNKSTITIITQPSKFKHLKHMMTRIQFVRQLYQDGLFIYFVKYVPTELLHSDLLTKPQATIPHLRHMRQFGVSQLLYHK